MTRTKPREAANRWPLVLRSHAIAFAAVIGMVSLVALAMAPGRLRAAQAEEPEVAEPVTETVKAKDGLVIRYTYYPGKGDTKTAPIILLHGVGEQRGAYDAFASYLQHQGHAVIVPDLRGHGDSTRYEDTEVPVLDDPDKLKAADFAKMAQFDLEAIKKVLVDKHNKEELNIELLCLVASDVSTIVAVNWAVQDWSWPQLPSIKQGQDVKALVLLSPQRSFKGYNCTRALGTDLFRAKFPIKLSILIAVGQKEPATQRDARSLFTLFERAYPKPELPPEPTVEDRFKAQHLFWAPADTELQGTELLDPRFRLGVAEFIADFVKYRLAEKAADYPWEKRSSQ